MTHSNKSASANDEKFDLEQSLTELEDIVSALEDGELSLEQAMEKFEYGVNLSRACQKALTEAEQKIQELVEASGKVELKDFDLSDDE